jgi:hypothetical protein
MDRGADNPSPVCGAGNDAVRLAVPPTHSLMYGSSSSAATLLSLSSVDAVDIDYIAAAHGDGCCIEVKTAPDCHRHKSLSSCFIVVCHR